MNAAQISRWLAGLCVLMGVGVVVLVWAAFAHPIHPSGQIDFGEIAVGVGTLMLAVATVGAVVVGGLALRGAIVGVSIAERNLEASQRPLLVPRFDEGQRALRDPSTELASRPARGPFGELLVPVTNIGTGPALSVQATVIGRDDAGGWSEVWEDHTHVGFVLGVGAGLSSAIAVRVKDTTGVANPLPSNFDVAISYRDLTGKAWITTAQYRRGAPPEGDPRYGRLELDSLPATTSDERLGTHARELISWHRRRLQP